jgi:hypothetical protein
MYNLINTINLSINVEPDKIATPVIGYLLEDTENHIQKIYSKEEAYSLVNKYGSENVMAGSRIDKDSGQILYYLKPKDKSVKINTFIKTYDGLEEGIIYTDEFMSYLRDNQELRHIKA